MRRNIGILYLIALSSFGLLLWRLLCIFLGLDDLQQQILLILVLLTVGIFFGLLGIIFHLWQIRDEILAALSSTEVKMSVTLETLLEDVKKDKSEDV